MNPAARRLTDTARQRQNEIGAETAALIAEIGEAYRSGQIGEDDLVTLYVAAEQRGHDASAALGAAYIGEFRRVQAPGEVHEPPVLDRFDVGASIGRAAGLVEDLKAIDPDDEGRDETARRTVSAHAARSHRHALSGGRRTMEHSAAANGTRWRRVTGANPCTFCGMLATRGFLDAGYSSRETALWDAEGRRYHDHCTCTAAEIIGELEPTAEEQRLIDLYNEAADGLDVILPELVLPRMRALGQGVLSDAPEPEKLESLTLPQLEERIEQAMSSGDWVEAERLGEILDASFWDETTGARVPTDDPMAPEVFDWFEQADETTRSRFLESLDEERHGNFAQWQWEYVTGKEARRVPTQREMRDAYEAYLEVEYVRAENATRGTMLSREARIADRHPRDLWKVNEATARAWASEEMLDYWDTAGRHTWTTWQASYHGEVEQLNKQAGTWLQ